MRAGSGFLALAVASTMCGCATLPPPPRPFPDEQIHDSGGVAYLWTAGRVDQPAMSLIDYAVVISIDGRALPSEYRPAAGTQPFVAWRVEVPVGRHAVEVLDKEETLVCSVLGGCLVMDDQTRVIEFVAEDSSTRQLAVSTGLPTVGGESPPEDSC